MRTIQSGRGQKEVYLCVYTIVAGSGTFRCETMLCGNNAQTNDSVVVAIITSGTRVGIPSVHLSSSSLATPIPPPLLSLSFRHKSTHFCECRLIERDCPYRRAFRVSVDWSSRKEKGAIIEYTRFPEAFLPSLNEGSRARPIATLSFITPANFFNEAKGLSEMGVNNCRR